MFTFITIIDLQNRDFEKLWESVGRLIYADADSEIENISRLNTYTGKYKYK